MPDWLIWMIVFWAIFGCGQGCRRARWGRRVSGRGSEGALDERASGTSGRLASGAHAGTTAGLASAPVGAAVASAGAASAAIGVQRPTETPLAKLQRQFVNDVITLEQYEEALDRLDRIE